VTERGLHLVIGRADRHETVHAENAERDRDDEDQPTRSPRRGDDLAPAYCENRQGRSV
jgi:hypothetical protein